MGSVKAVDQSYMENGNDIIARVNFILHPQDKIMFKHLPYMIIFHKFFINLVKPNNDINV